MTIPRLHALASRTLLLGSCAAALACSESSIGDAPPLPSTDGGGGGGGAGGGGGGSEGGASTWQSGAITVVEQPGSLWSVAEVDGEVVAEHQEGGIELLIDPSNAEGDGRYAGVYLFDEGQLRFTGSYYGSDCSMFVPDRPHVDQTSVSVSAIANELTIEMSEGSLSEMVDSQYPSDEPFRWTSTWTVESQGVGLRASGLYYLLPPKAGCELTVLGEGGTELGVVQIDSDTSPFVDYFDEVRTIEIDSQLLGSLSVATDARVLQVQVPSYPDTSLFELDFDHSFKDHGQSDVPTELLLPRAQ